MLRCVGIKNGHFFILDDEDGVTEEITRNNLVRVMASGVVIDGLSYDNFRIVVNYMSVGKQLAKRLLLQGIDVRVNGEELLWLSLREDFTKERRIVLSEFCNRVADKVLPLGGEAWRNQSKVTLVFDDAVYLKGSCFNLNARYNIGFLDWLFFDLTSLTDADVVYTYLMRAMGLSNDVSKRIIDNPERLIMYQVISRILYGGKLSDVVNNQKELGVVMWNSSKLFRRSIKQLLKRLESDKDKFSSWSLDIYSEYNFDLIKAIPKYRPLAKYFQHFKVSNEADKLFKQVILHLVRNN